MKIKKSLVVLIFMAALINVSLFHSFATVNTTPITSPIGEPQPYLKTVGDHIEVSAYYVVNRPGNLNELYQVVASYPLGTTVKFMFTFPSGNNSNQRVRLWSDNSPLSSADWYLWDITTGNFIESGIDEIKQEAGGYTVTFRSGYFPRKLGIYYENDFNYGYPIIPQNLQIYAGTYPEVLNVEPYVTWSQLPPEHNIYHSVLSEPVADKYNRYFIIDDKLYWVSFRLNGAYVKVDDILTKSEYESYTSNGEYMGAVSSASGNQLITIGSQTTYNDWEVYPVNFKNQSYFDDNLMYLSLYYTDQGLKLRLNIDQMALVHALSTDKLFIEYEFYVSDFTLSDGTFSNSSYSSATSFISSNIDLNYDLPNEIHDIKCYGIEFLNADNLPVNLSDVLWQYDQEFIEWRDQMLQMLHQIYNALAEPESELETHSYENIDQDIKDNEPSFAGDVSPDEAESVLNSAFDYGIFDFRSAASAVAAWVRWFEVGKLLAVVAVALSLGVAIIVLGKKKSE